MVQWGTYANGHFPETASPERACGRGCGERRIPIITHEACESHEPPVTTVICPSVFQPRGRLPEVILYLRAGPRITNPVSAQRAILAIPLFGIPPARCCARRRGTRCSVVFLRPL